MKNGGSSTLDDFIEKSDIKKNLDHEQQIFDMYLEKLKTGEASMFPFMNN